jgi:hypothetical protein
LKYCNFLQCNDDGLTAVLDESFSLESCITILKGLEENGKANVNSGVGVEAEEQHIRAVVAAAKTPRRRLLKVGEDTTFSGDDPIIMEDEKGRAEVEWLKFDVVQIQWVIGTRLALAPYLSLHGGLESAFKTLLTLEGVVTTGIA